MKNIITKQIPVVMFHSVGNEQGDWSRYFLSVSLKHFDRFCRYLAVKKIKTILLNDWYEIQLKSYNNRIGTICLTFDDGYLDNWVYVYPILKKYNLRATIFINPEFVDPSDEVRPNLENVGFEVDKIDRSKCLGFLSWSEIKIMDESRVMDVQSHTMSHNFYFCSPKLIDIFTGQNNYDWLHWLLQPERKSYYISDFKKTSIPLGYPIFEFGRSLELKRYFPSLEFIDYSIQYFKFCKEAEYGMVIKELQNKVNLFPGRFETDDELKKRYEYEIIISKSILEEKLNKKVDFLCWPGGGYNELAIEISKKAGYKASTLASREKRKDLMNHDQYKRIPRFGMGSFIYKNGKRKISYNSNYLVYNFKSKTGSFPSKLLLKSIKLLS